jgi:cyclohexanecarboxyl-CoA dehydrogenase
MEFALTSEQEAIRDMARRFASERLAPGYQAREAEGRMEPELIEEMGTLGLIAPDMPEEVGGAGTDGVTAGVITEEIAAGDFSFSYPLLLGSLNGSILMQHAAPEVANPVVADICAGKSVVALGLTEPGGGSDAANLKLKARRENDAYVLNGEKTSISMADQASHIILFARTGTEEERARGVTAFLVPMDAPGVSYTRFNDVGHGIVGRGSVFFDEVRVVPELRLGLEGQGFHQVMHGFDYSRALIGLQCLGPAWASLQETWQYATEREAFGQPIAKFQGVTEPLAEAETLLTAARLLAYKTLWLRDHDQPHTSEAAMCKWWIPKLSFEVIHRCLLTHGHMGYSRDLPHQQRLRDVLGLQIGDGTEQIQKMVIAREKIGRIAVPYA